MYERMLDKFNEPTAEQVKDYLGSESYKRLVALEDYLKSRYLLSKEMRFPFGSNYGWGYKYSHKTAHLCYAFFEKDAFTVTLQIGDKQVHLVEDMFNTLSHKTRELWNIRYPCGEHGGWVHYRVLGDDDLTDICKLIEAKKKPA